MNYKVFLIWLSLVTLWNFGIPTAPPIFDVISAVVLSFFSNYLEKYGFIRKEKKFKKGFLGYEYYRRRMIDIYCM